MDCYKQHVCGHDLFPVSQFLTHPAEAPAICNACRFQSSNRCYDFGIGNSHRLQRSK